MAMDQLIGDPLPVVMHRQYKIIVALHQRNRGPGSLSMPGNIREGCLSDSENGDTSYTVKRGFSKIRLKPAPDSNMSFEFVRLRLQGLHQAQLVQRARSQFNRDSFHRPDRGRDNTG